MNFTDYLTACKSSPFVYEALLAIQPTSVEAKKAFNVCGLTLVSFTRLHNRCIVLSGV